MRKTNTLFKEAKNKVQKFEFASFCFWTMNNRCSYGRPGRESCITCGVDRKGLNIAQKCAYLYKVAGRSDPNDEPPLSPREALQLTVHFSATYSLLRGQKTAAFKAIHELWTRIFASKTADLKARDGLQKRIFCAKNSRSESKFKRFVFQR